MNAFAAAEKNGRAADLPREWDVLFVGQNQGPSQTTSSMPATFLRATATL
jgi:hypothetical protein